MNEVVKKKEKRDRERCVFGWMQNNVCACMCVNTALCRVYMCVKVTAAIVQYSSSPFDECDEECALGAQVLHCGAACADLTTQHVVEDLRYVLLGLLRGHTPTHTHTHSLTHTHTPTHTHTLTHTLTPTHTYTHTHTHTLTRSHSHTHSHPHPLTHTLTHTHTHTHSHIHPHTHTHTHILTHSWHASSIALVKSTG